MVGYMRRPQAGREPCLLKWKLRRFGKTVANLFPMDEIFAVKDGKTREVRKRAVNKIVVGTNSAHTRIWVKARNDRVLIALRKEGIQYTMP